VIDAPLAVAFGAGMLATVNPCGFAMLPAYLSYFLGVDEHAEPISTLRALGVGAIVSAGFMSLFAVAGALLSWLSIGVYDIAPWVTLLISLALVVLGIAMLAGWEPIVNLPKLERGGRSRTFVSMYVFGVSYAIASLGCTLPVFVATVSGTVRRHDAVSGLAVYVAYGFGMALVLMLLTVAIAGARSSLVHRLRGILPYVSRLAGGLVLIAGLYVGWYGILELRSQRATGTVESGRAISTVTGWSGSISNWVDRVGAVRLGMIFGLVIAITVFVALLRSPASDPPLAAEPGELQDRGDDDEHPRVEVPVLPVELRHAPEVLSVEAHDEGGQQEQ
jgi:cytochrome c biogenesis protein CcdA